MRLIEFRSSADALHPCPNAILSANQFIRKMHGGSQSILVGANDGNHYIVKMTDNPQGPNLLANESMGCLVAKSVGLPVADPRSIFISASFIDRHPRLWFETQTGVRRPDAGVHFASPFIGRYSGPERPTEYISPSNATTISNREDFLGMYLLDVWANHQDKRQAVFIRRPDNFHNVFFIDHGHMFGGPDWKFQTDPHSALHPVKAVYAGLWEGNAVTNWVSRFQAVIPKVLPSVARSMQDNWYRGDLAELVGNLTDRLIDLPKLVQRDYARNWSNSRTSTTDVTLTSSDPGIDAHESSDDRQAPPLRVSA